MNMFLKNGNMETVFTLNQFENILAENLGSDALIVMDELVKNENSSVELIQQDLDIAYDSIRNLENALNEANNLISDLLYMYLGNVKRIDRKKIEKDLEEIYKATELSRIEY